MTVSVAAIAVLVKVKLTTAAAASAAAFIVMAPQILLSVTPVALLVICVTVPPAPVAYPMPALGDEDFMLDENSPAPVTSSATVGAVVPPMRVLPPKMFVSFVPAW